MVAWGNDYICKKSQYRQCLYKDDSNYLSSWFIQSTETSINKGKSQFKTQILTLSHSKKFYNLFFLILIGSFGAFESIKITMC